MSSANCAGARLQGVHDRLHAMCLFSYREGAGRPASARVKCRENRS